MKSQRGITLISLTIYVIGMSIIIGIISIISTFFYKNVEKSDVIDSITQYTNFNRAFAEEVNRENIKVLACGQGNKQNYIVFDNGVQYTFIQSNKGIYRNKVKICEGIERCIFSYDIQNGKNVVNVDIQDIEGKERKRTYTLRN